MRERIQRFMQGRYGNDQLNQFIMLIIMLCLVFSFFAGRIFYWMSLLLMFLLYFRIFSRNVTKRSGENMVYLQKTEKFRSAFFKQKNLLLQRKTHHIYKCPSCRQKIRIPRGRGKVMVRCPKCNTEFVKRS